MIYSIQINGIFELLLKNLSLKKLVVRIFFAEKNDNLIETKSDCSMVEQYDNFFILLEYSEKLKHYSLELGI